VRCYFEAARFRELQGKPDLWWYCPNGHKQHFTGNSYEQQIKKLKRDKEEAVAQLNRRLEMQKQTIYRLEDRRICDVCHQEFHNQNALNSHKRVHKTRRTLAKNAGPDAFGHGRGLVDDSDGKVVSIKKHKRKKAKA
jgi:hypothetical protein